MTTTLARAESALEPQSAIGQQYLTFGIKGELYAIEILRVREIVRHENLTRVPYAPDWVRGVMNLRGSVVPVADLAIRFALPETELDRKTCVLIVEIDVDCERTNVGLLAESVHDVITLAPEDIEPPPALGTHVWADFLIGLGRHGERFAQLLDVPRLLAHYVSA